MTPRGGAGPGQMFAVGQKAHAGDFDVTLKQVKNPYISSNQLVTAPTGQHFVAVEILASNTAEDQKALSGLNVKIHDSQGRAGDIGVAGIELPQLDGILTKGEGRDGWVVFAVGNDATGLTLRVKGDITSTGAAFSLG